MLRLLARKTKQFKRCSWHHPKHQSGVWGCSVDCHAFSNCWQCSSWSITYKDENGIGDGPRVQALAQALTKSIGSMLVHADVAFNDTQITKAQWPRASINDDGKEFYRILGRLLFLWVRHPSLVVTCHYLWGLLGTLSLCLAVFDLFPAWSSLIDAVFACSVCSINHLVHLALCEIICMTVEWHR